MDRESLAWCAGFFEGEGNVGAGVVVKNGQRRHFIQVQVVQITPAPLERMRSAIGFGRVFGPYKRNPPQRPIYVYRARGSEQVQAFIAMIWPWLLPVKRTQAKVALAKMRHVLAPPKDRTICANGHRYADNVVVYIREGKPFRRCRLCERAAAKRNHDRHPRRTGRRWGREKQEVCRRGHPLVDENVILSVVKRGKKQKEYIGRRCRQCQREYMAEYHAGRHRRLASVLLEA